MAKSIDLSGLKRKPVKRPEPVNVDEVVKTIHKSEVSPKEPVPVEEDPKEKQRNVRITVDLPEDLHMELKLRSIREKTTIRKYVIGLLEEKLRG